MHYPPRRYEKLLIAKKLSLYTLILLLSLFLMKLVLGLATGSVALIADAFHSLSDTLMIVAAYLSLRICLTKPARTFPYGYYRFEDIISLLMAIGFLGLSGYIIWYGIHHALLGFQGSEHFELAFGTAMVAGILSLYFAEKLIKAAKEAGVVSLGLSARDLKYDAIAAFSVAISIILNVYYPFPFEAYASIGLGIFIAITAIKGGKIAIMNLLDAWRNPDIVSKIRKIISKYEKLKPGRVRLRKSGPIVYGDAIIYAPEEMRLEDLDDIISKIEDEIYEAIPELQDILLEIEPLEETVLYCAIPVKDGGDLKAGIVDSFEKASKFVIVAIDMKNKTFKPEKIIPNYFLNKKNAEVKISKRLIREEIDFVIVKNIGEVAFELLKAYSVDTYLTDEDIGETAVRKFLDNELKMIEDYSEISNNLSK